MLNINQKLFYFINNMAGAHPWLDSFFVFLTTTGFYLILIFVFVYIFVISPLQKSNPTERLRAWGQAMFVTISVFITWALVWYIKVLAMVPRPFEVLPGVHQLVEQSFKTSFPSSHTAVAVALATAVYFYHKKLGVVLFAAAIFIGFSRIFVGVHYPLDVLAGACIGILASFLLVSIFRPSRV